MSGIIRRTAAAFLAFLFLFSAALTEQATPEKIPEPTLQPDAPAYDTDHPEELVPEQLYALSAVLMTEDKGEVIFEKDPDEIRYPASTTKILTVLLGIMMVDDLEEKVTVSPTALMIPEDSSTMKLKEGEEIRFIDVLYGTMMLSGNDGANVIAETVSGSVDRFVDLMNETAAAYGCTSTHFVNAHGYHDDNHYTTARDMALITRRAMQNETFREIVRATTWSIPRTNKQRARTITTKSEYMLTGTAEKPNKYYYEYATGVKTGSHSHSGYCFVGAAEKDGVRLISVVFFTGNRARWADTIKLMNYGFSQYTSVTPVQLYQMNPITVETSNYSTSDTNRGKLLLTCQPSGPESSSARIVATKSEIRRMSENLQDFMLIQYTRDFSAPITVGEQMGTMMYFPEIGEPVTYILTASRSIAQRDNVPKTLEEIISETYSDPNPFPPFGFEMAMLLFSPLLLLLVFFLVVLRIRRSRRKKGLHTPKPVNRYVK
jgi:D-alanyl-D-alanine carboxypeptidase (penicillin-binding protein 5/6)